MIYRGSVVKVCEDSIVVITEDCTFEKIKKITGLKEGMEIYFEETDIIKERGLTIKTISTVAAAILLLFVTSIYGIAFWSTNYKAIAVLSVDINPSIEIEINKNHNVIKASAINEDASSLPLKSLKNKPWVDALEELVEMADTKGYVKATETNYILVAAVELKGYKEDNKILEELLIEGKEKIEITSNEKGQHIEVVTIKSDKETLKKAKEEHISVGKMEIYEKIKNNDKNIKEEKAIQELKRKNVKNLIEEITKTKDLKPNKNQTDSEAKFEEEDKKHDRDIIKNQQNKEDEYKKDKGENNKVKTENIRKVDDDNIKVRSKKEDKPDIDSKKTDEDADYKEDKKDKKEDKDKDKDEKQDKDKKQDKDEKFKEGIKDKNTDKNKEYKDKERDKDYKNKEDTKDKKTDKDNKYDRKDKKIDKDKEDIKRHKDIGDKENKYNAKNHDKDKGDDDD